MYANPGIGLEYYLEMLKSLNPLTETVCMELEIGMRFNALTTSATSNSSV